MAGVKITAARDVVGLGQGGQLRTIRHYEYTIEDKGPFIFEIDQAEDSPDRLKVAIDKTRKSLEQPL